VLVSYVSAETAEGEWSLWVLARAGVVFPVRPPPSFPPRLNGIVSLLRHGTPLLSVGSTVYLSRLLWDLLETRISGGSVGIGGLSCPLRLCEGIGGFWGKWRCAQCCAECYSAVNRVLQAQETSSVGCSGDKRLFPEIFSRGLSCAAHIIVRAVTIRDYHKVYGDTVEIMGM
jgi:hypothetical protein